MSNRGRMAPRALLLLMVLPLAVTSGKGPRAVTPDGVLRGLSITRPSGTTQNTVYAFLGIPYALPPVGERRFKDPEQTLPWQGIRNATTYGPHCIQKPLGTEGSVIGEEDCLYLNVFTVDPPEAWAAACRPVIVIFHGGAFVVWNGDMATVHPDPLLRRGAVVVAINYRLGVMGFLNTEDSQAPGNAGLKDQLAALRWVQRNIAAFGGDPGNVTIMGESAGGASVHFHLLSPLSRGLFRRAVSVSGSVLPSWTHVQGPRQHALQLRRLWASACPDLPDHRIVACLQRVDAAQLVDRQYDIPLQPFQNYFLKAAFLPAAEAPSAGAAPFLPAEPERLLRAGCFARVPYLSGSVSAEGAVFLNFANLITNSSKWPEVDKHFEDIFMWEMPRGLRTRAVAKQVREFYLGNRTLSDARNDPDTLQRIVQMATDVFIAVGTWTSARIMAEHGAQMYVYKFTRDGPGSLDFAKEDLNATDISGVFHGDDMAYVYDFTGTDGVTLLPVPVSEQPVRERQADIFYNMAATGNPTPAGSGLVQWPAFDPRRDNYMRMDVDLSVHDHVLGDRTAFWNSLLASAQPTSGSRPRDGPGQ